MKRFGYHNPVVVAVGMIIADRPYRDAKLGLKKILTPGKKREKYRGEVRTRYGK